MSQTRANNVGTRPHLKKIIVVAVVLLALVGAAFFIAWGAGKYTATHSTSTVRSYLADTAASSGLFDLGEAASSAVEDRGFWEDPFGAVARAIGVEGDPEDVQGVEPLAEYMHVKYLLVDEDKVAEDETIDSIWSSEEHAVETVYGQYESTARLYKVHGQDYYMALADATGVNGAGGKVIDVEFALNDTEGHRVDGITYDNDSGVIYIPEDVLRSAGEHGFQAQFLLPYSLEDTSSFVTVDIESARGDVKAADTSRIEVDSIDNVIEIPIVDPADAAKITLDDIEVASNDLLYSLVDGDTAVYDQTTGVLSLGVNSIGLSDLSIRILPSGVMGTLLNVFSPSQAVAADRLDANSMRSYDNGETYFDKLNLMTMREGSTYQYGAWMHYQQHIWGNAAPYGYCYGAGGESPAYEIADGASWTSIQYAAWGSVWYTLDNSCVRMMACNGPWDFSYGGQNFHIGGARRMMNLALDCSHCWSPMGERPSDDPSGGGWWDTMWFRVLKIQKSGARPYIICGFIAPETNGQSCCAIYKFRVKATGDISVAKTANANPALGISPNSPVSGVQFSVYTDAACTNKLATSRATASNGKVVIEGFPEGEYWVKEVNPPWPYIRSTRIEKVYVKPNETSYVSFADDSSSVIQLRKYQLPVNNTYSSSTIHFPEASSPTTVQVDATVTGNRNVSYRVNMANGSGTVVCTLPDQISYQGCSGNVSASGQTLTITGSATVNARIKDDAGWTASQSSALLLTLNSNKSNKATVAGYLAPGNFSGTQYSLYASASAADNDTGRIATMELDSNGYAEYGNVRGQTVLMPNTTYYVKETHHVSPYNPDHNVYAVTTASNNSVLKVVQETSSAFELYKQSTWPNLVKGNSAYQLGNAVYRIYSTQGDADYKTNYNIVATLTTSAAGTDKVLGIAPGTYWIKEITPSRGYETDDETHQITVTEGNTATLTSKEPLQVKIAIKKTTNNPDTLGLDTFTLEGAQFGIYKSESDAQNFVNEARIVTTDRNGVCPTVIMRADNYWIREISAPAHYIRNDSIKMLRCEGDFSRNLYQTVTFGEDPQFVSLNATKQVDSLYRSSITESMLQAEGGHGPFSLTGTQFSVYRTAEDAAAGTNPVTGMQLRNGQGEPTGETVDVLTADINGNTETVWLPPRTNYYVKETTAPPGGAYQPSNMVRKLSYQSTMSNSATFADSPKPVKLTINKASRNPNVFEISDKYTVAGTVFGVYKTQSEAEANGAPYRELTVKADGTTDVLDLPWQPYYYVRERSTTPGFHLSDVVTAVPFTAVMSDATATTPATIETQFSPDGGFTSTVNLKNDPIYTYVKVSKVSERPTITSSSAAYSLANAKFGVYANYSDVPSTATLVSGGGYGNYLDIFETDEQGIGISKCLFPGTYYVKELEPSLGFLRNPTVFTVQSLEGPAPASPDTPIVLVNHTYVTETMSGATVSVKAQDGALTIDLSTTSNWQVVNGKFASYTAQYPLGINSTTTTLRGAGMYFGADKDSSSADTSNIVWDTTSPKSYSNSEMAGRQRYFVRGAAQNTVSGAGTLTIHAQSDAGNITNSSSNPGEGIGRGVVPLTVFFGYASDGSGAAAYTDWGGNKVIERTFYLTTGTTFNGDDIQGDPLEVVEQPDSAGITVEKCLDPNTPAPKLTPSGFEGTQISMYGSRADAENRSNPIKTLTIGSTSDSVTFDNLTQGKTYFFRETHPLEWYTLNNNVYSATATGSRVYIAIPNQPKAVTIHITKENSRPDITRTLPDEYSLVGTTFGIYKTSSAAAAGGEDGLVESLTVTDETGQVTSSPLPPADAYYVREIIAPRNYTLNATVRKVESRPSDANRLMDVNLAFTNNPEFTYIDVTKQLSNADNIINLDDYSLNGAFYTVYPSEAEAKAGLGAVASGTIQSGNTVTIGPLPPGTYYVREERSPAYATLDDTPRRVNATTLAHGTVTFTNDPDPIKIRIHKVVHPDVQLPLSSLPAGTSLDGAIYGVYRNAELTDDALVEQVVTANGGYARSSALHPDRYWVKEIAPSPGFLPDPAVYQIIPESGKSDYEVESPEKLDAGYLAVTKVSNHPDWLDGDLSGAVFTVYSDRECTNQVTQLVTGADGKATSEPLAIGTYYVVETAALPGHAASTAIREVVVSSRRTTVIGRTDGVENRTAAIQVHKQSADPTISDSADYSVEGAIYGVFTDKGGDPASQVKVAQPGAPFAEDAPNVILTVEADGYSNVAELIAPEGTYYIREMAAPDGFELDETDYEVVLNAESESGINLVETSDVPTSNKEDIRIVKYSTETGGAATQGTTNLENTEFTVNYYPATYDQDDVVDKRSPNVDGTDYQVVDQVGSIIEPDRTWVVSTNRSGVAHLSPEYLLDEESDDLFRNSEGTVCIPKGTLVISETKAPDGYTIGKAAPFIFQSSGDASLYEPQLDTTLEILGEVSARNYIMRGDVSFSKVDANSGNALSKVPFSLQMLDNDGNILESHLIFTDGEGNFDSGALAHDINTNAYDEKYYAEDETSLFSGDIESCDLLDDTKKNSNIGTWFSGLSDGATVPVLNERGALPYGKYRLVEVMTRKNLAYDPINPVYFEINEENQSVDLGTIYNRKIEITSTAARDLNTNSQTGSLAAPTNAIIDRVNFAHATNGRTYTFTATVYDVTDRANPTMVATTVPGAGGAEDFGKAMSASCSYTHPADAQSDTGYVEIQIPSTDFAELLAGKTVAIVTEVTCDTARADVHNAHYTEEIKTYTYEVDGVQQTQVQREDVLVLELDQPSEEISYPSISTSAVDKVTGYKMGFSDSNVGIVDTLHYTDLIPGETYSVSGTVYDRKTRFPLRDAEGYVVASSYTVYTDNTGSPQRSDLCEFVPNASEGDVTVYFEFSNGIVNQGFTAVVFETVNQNNAPIIAHANLDDPAQTVYYPELDTVAVDDSTGQHEGYGAGVINLTDTISYSLLQSKGSSEGRTFYVRGELFDQRTGASLGITSDVVSFDYDGEQPASVDNHFSFNRSALGDCRSIVVYEELWDGVPEANGSHLIAVHKDRTDGDQGVGYPFITTQAADALTGKEIGALGDSISIVDTVHHSGLVIGRTYRIEGKVFEWSDASTPIDPETATPLTTGTKTIRATGDSSTTVQFDPITTKNSAFKCVIFERVYNENNQLVASHEEVADLDQVLYYPEITATVAHETDTEGQSGTTTQSINITDQVSYAGLWPGKEYTIKGVLYKVKDGVVTEVVDERGNLRESRETTFTATEPSGATTVTFDEFSMDESELEGANLVVFETIYYQGQPVAYHVDAGDADQSIFFPLIDTVAVDKTTGTHVGKPAAENIKVTDTVTCTNLIKGASYRLDAELSLPSGEVISTASDTFTASADSTSHVHYMEIDVPSDKVVDGANVVVMETLSRITTNGSAFQVEKHADLSDADQTVSYPTISTHASDATTSIQEGLAEGTVTITDHFCVDNVAPGIEYTVEGSLRFKDGEDPHVAAVAPAVFTPTTNSYEGDMTFEVPASVVAGKKVVVFEELKYNGGVLLAEHKDLNDVAQTVSYPSISTAAVDKGTGKKQGHANGTVTIQDEVSFTNLVPGNVYAVSGRLMTQAANGTVSEVPGFTCEGATFNASAADGSIMIEFSAPAASVEGKKVVVYETLTTLAGGEPVVVAKHENINDAAQTVSYAAIGTTASDTVTSTKEGRTDGNLHITDTISYSNLVPGTTYFISGSVRDKSSGNVITAKDGTPVVLEDVRFVPDTADGFTGMVFSFENVDLAGKTVVVFEKIATAPNGEEVVASHENINDVAQTLTYPAIATHACDSSTTTHEGLVSNGIVSDRVTLDNLVAGHTYTVRGELHDTVGNVFKDKSGSPITSSHGPFVLQDGQDSVTLEFDASNAELAGKTVVVYEELLDSAGVVIATHADPNDAEQTVRYPSIGTTATDKATNTHSGRAGESNIIVDTIEYENLVAGNRYIVAGELRDKDTGAAIEKAPSVAVTSREEFVAAASGSTTVEFDLDGVDVSGKTIVVFERLYDTAGHLVAVHENINDAEQTVRYPSISTNARDSVSGTKMGMPSADGNTVIDTVSYENLVPGEAYTLHASLMDKSTRMPLENSSGQKIEASVALVPQTPDGSQEIPIKIDGADLTGKTVVVYEELRDSLGNVVAVHKDLSDAAQTVSFGKPSIYTTAVDKHTGVQTGYVNRQGNAIVDTVYYENLSPSTRYVLEGTAMDRSSEKPLTGADGKAITATKQFMPSKSSGSVDVEFNLQGVAVDGGSVVIFETLKTVSDNEVLVEHNDINNIDQTVSYTVPFVSTTATDSITGTHAGCSVGDVVINDLVSYANLFPGVEYTVSGVLMDKATGAPLISNGGSVLSTMTFTAVENAGSIVMPFNVPSADIAGKTVVVFETITDSKGNVLVKHEDIDDDAQTVAYAKLGTFAHYGDGSHNIKLSLEDGAVRAIIIDTVSFENLVPDKHYILRSHLVNKETGAVVQQDGSDYYVETKFQPNKPNNELDIEFSLAPSEMGEWTVVAFEELYDLEGHLLAAHQDINDEAQTVFFDYTNKLADDSIDFYERQIMLPGEPEPQGPLAPSPAPASNVKAASTGDAVLWTLLAGLAVATAAAATLVLIRRKRK